MLSALATAATFGKDLVGPERRPGRIPYAYEAGTEPRLQAPLCAAQAGITLHASTHVEAGDRSGRERLIKYILAAAYWPRAANYAHESCPSPSPSRRRMTQVATTRGRCSSRARPRPGRFRKGRAAVLARWTQGRLLKARTFGEPTTACPECGGELRFRALVQDPHSTLRILTHVGLPTDVPRRAPARGPPYYRGRVRRVRPGRAQQECSVAMNGKF